MLTHEKRILASIIDVGIVVILSLFINIFVSESIFNNEATFLIICSLVGFVYVFVSLLISKDRTIGLYSMSLRLLDRDWSRPDIKIVLLRSLTFGVLPLYIVNILYMILNKSETTFFDEISNSFIISSGDAYKIDNNH